MRDNSSAAQPLAHHKVLTSPEEIAHGIEGLRHLIEQVKDLEKDVPSFDDTGKNSADGHRVPDEVLQFHARREIVITERQVRQSIGEIFGKSSPEARASQNLRINASTKTSINETVTALEGFIFRLEEKRLELVGARHDHAAQNADIDPLTDLCSRRVFDRYMMHELDRSERYGYSCALLFFSLRNWRAVHLAHGPSVSNAVLVRMACACKATLRGHDYACRIAEDEFAVLLPQSDSQGARSVSRRIAARFELAIAHLSPDLNLKLEFGTATFPFDAETPANLFHTAVTHRMCFTPDLSEIKMPV
jgi:diguanylate cyclase (GGDEF)-like protein